MSMADNYPKVQSPLFDSADLFESGNTSGKKMPDYGRWEAKSSDSIVTSSSDEYSS